jgi:hypothetical protein
MSIGFAGVAVAVSGVLLGEEPSSAIAKAAPSIVF